MGKIDEAMFQVLQHKDYFADVCNAVLFHGEQRIQPQRLQPMNIRQGVLERKRERKKKKKGKNGLSITDYRDAVFTRGLYPQHKAADSGCEAQSERECPSYRAATGIHSLQILSEEASRAAIPVHLTRGTI